LKIPKTEVKYIKKDVDISKAHTIDANLDIRAASEDHLMKSRKDLFIN
jgi:hypothetical protein